MQRQSDNARSPTVRDTDGKSVRFKNVDEGSRRPELMKAVEFEFRLADLLYFCAWRYGLGCAAQSGLLMLIYDLILGRTTHKLLLYRPLLSIFQ